MSERPLQISSIYHAGIGTLQLYAHHVTPPAAPGGGGGVAARVPHDSG